MQCPIFLRRTEGLQLHGQRSRFRRRQEGGASPVFHAIEFGLTILYVVAQSNQNRTACIASGEFSCAVLRFCEMKLPPSCPANIHQIFQGSNESEGSIS